MVGDQCDEQAAGRSARDLERIRDDNLVAIMQALKLNGWGAGQVLADYEVSKRIAPPTPDLTQPIRTLDRVVPADWTDYNNHMTEGRYLTAFSEATDQLMEIIGADQDYIAGGLSYFTVETHLRHLDEVRALEPIYALTQVIEGAGKKLRLFHWLHHGDGRLLATAEHMLIHVSLETRAACPPEPAVATKLSELAALHAALPAPEGLGRAVGQRA